VPFTMIKGDRRFVDPDSTAAVTFGRPAPAGSHLRFSGMGERFEVSFDGGSSWRQAQQPSQITSNGSMFSNYWTPVPPGTRRVDIRGSKGWMQSWIAKDFSIWSEAAPA
jgi:hypothetical protein